MRRRGGKNIIDINKYFDNIYCLNLDSRADRWKAVSKRFKKYGIRANRVSAVDGNSKENIARYKSIVKKDKHHKKLGYKLIRSPGALGCILSYRKIINDARLNGYKKILILEDDVIFSKKFTEEFSNISSLTKNWKLLYLGASQHDWSGVKIGRSEFYNAWHSQGTFAIGIDCSIYSEILHITNKPGIPIDSCLAVNIQKKYKNKCFVFYPNIVIADVSNSDIRSDVRDIGTHSKLMRWRLNRYDI